MNRRRKNTPQDTMQAGSIWTSMSDLFTSVAIIFLLMFVFALVKSSVTAFDMVQTKKVHQDYLKGRVPSDVSAANQQRTNDLSQSLAQLETYRLEVNKRTEELNQLIQQMVSHETIVKKLMAEQEKQAAAVAHMRESIEKKDDLLASQAKTIKRLEQEHKTEMAALKLRHRQALSDAKIDENRAIAQMKTQSAQQVEQARSEARLAVSSQRQSMKAAMEAQDRQTSDLKQDLRRARSNLAQAEGKLAANGHLRKNIGASLAERFAAAELDVQTDPETGSVSLSIDDLLLFHNDSFKLRDEVKGRLKQIIPIYAQELLGNPDMGERIEAINVVGHASPRHAGQAIDPMNAPSEAYNHNLVLSTNRAREIVKFIFSEEFGNFDKKYAFRDKVVASGKSFSEPKLATMSDTERDAPSKCGQYDCKKSRRVEIMFTLKEPNQPGPEAVAH